MNQGLPQRRRQARAIAISESADARRTAAITRFLVLLGSVALLFEAVIAAQNMWTLSHP